MHSSVFMEYMRVISVCLNVLLGGSSSQTLCGRVYGNRHARRRYAMAHRILNIVFFWDRDHCRSSYVGDVRRAQHIVRTYGKV